MTDLNSLLRWAVENSTPGQDQGAQEGGMTLKFKPAKEGQQASKTAATLHPSDGQYPIADLSPASTPGPGTPKDGEQPLPAPRSDLTTEMLDLIMGKSDSLTMKEKMETATDESVDTETRVEALDDFEMLVELIDNANNMAVLKLWEPLLSLFDSPIAEIQRHALWICGTACQNNLKAQACFFIHDALPKIFDLIYPPAGAKAVAGPTRAKAVYALSSALKHWPLASEALSANSDRGYQALRDGVADSELVIKRKMTFLLGTLVAQASDKFDPKEMPSEVRNVLEEHAKAAGGKHEDLVKGLERTGVFKSSLAELAKVAGMTDADDVQYEEDAVRALSRAAAADGLSADEKKNLRGIWEQWGAEGQKERGYEGQDAADITQSLA